MQTSNKTPAIMLMALLTAAGLPILGAPVAQAAASTCAISVGELHWLDLDHNGHLDAVRVVTTPTAPASAVVDEATVYPADFNFGSGAAPRRGTGIDKGTAGDGQFYLFFPEGNSLDGGPSAGTTATFAPAFLYSASDGKVHVRAFGAAGGNPDAAPAPASSCFSNGTAVKNFDEAAPFLMAGYAVASATAGSVTAVFNEPVQMSPGACTGTPPAGPACFAASGLAPATDFCVETAAGDEVPIYGIAAVGSYPALAFTLSLGKSVAAVTTVASNPTITASAPAFILADEGRRITGGSIPAGTTVDTYVSPTKVTLSAAPTAASTSATVSVFTPLVAADVAVQNLPTGSNLPAKLFPGSCTAPFAPFIDRVGPTAGSGGNAGLLLSYGWSSWPVGAVPIGAPIPVQVSASASDRTVFVEFTGPVMKSGGGAVNGGFTVTTSGTPWGVTATSTPGGLGSDRVILTASIDIPAPLSDSSITTQPNQVVGVGSSTTATTPSMPGSMSFAITDDTFLSRPHVVKMETVDGDTNGCIDAIRITLNEQVNDANLGAADEWKVYWASDGTETAAVAAVTGGAAPSGTGAQVPAAANMILYAPLDATKTNDKVFFLTFPGAADIDTPGTASCHGTGALRSTGYSALPRVSFTTTTPPEDLAGMPLTAGHYPPSACPALPAAMCAVAPNPVTGTPAMYRDPVLDAAAPVVTTASTRDCMATTGCTPNGHLSGMNVTFSETVADSAFVAGGWQAQDTVICTTDGAPAPIIYTLSGTSNMGTGNGPYHGLTFTELSQYDTGCIPELTTTGASPITDAAGNQMAPVQRGPRLAGTGHGGTAGVLTLDSAYVNLVDQGASPNPQALGVSVGTTFQVTKATNAATVGTYTVTGVTATQIQFSGPDLGAGAGSVMFVFPNAVSEVDRAGPVLVKLQGTVGSAFAEAHFSEKVCHGTGAPATCPPNDSDAFQYVNAGAGGATAIVDAKDPTPADPIPNKNNVVELTLSAPLATTDISGKDCVRLVAPNPVGAPGGGAALTDVGPGATSNPASGYNLPYPRPGLTGNPCVLWGAGAGPHVVSLVTIDSNEDGYLDALRVDLDQPIRDGTRILRHDDGNGVADAADAIYFDMQTPGTAGSGAVGAGDFRFGAGTTVACPADADCGTSIDPSYSVLWADLGAIGTASSSTDGLWVDVDNSNTVSDGDYRAIAAPAIAAGSVSCAGPRDADCGRTVMAGYTDNDHNGWVSTGDVRPAVPALGSGVSGTVTCASGSPQADCGAGTSPTTANLLTVDPATSTQIFKVAALNAANTQPIITCVLTGKGAGPILGGSALTSCPSGVGGASDPLGGAVPGISDSCAGALDSDLNDATFFICFTPWSKPANPPSAPLPKPIPNTGYLPKLTYTPAGTSGGTYRSLTDDTPMGGFTDTQATDGARPVLVMASVENGPSTATLRFSEPVGSGTLSTNDIAYINDNHGQDFCRSGADSLTGIAAATPGPSSGTWGAGMFNATATIHGALSHDDIVGCIQGPPPTPQVVARDGLRATPTLLEKGGARSVVPKFVPFTDNDRPQVASAGFLDANGDGTIDVVKVVFTEAVNDCFMSHAMPPAAPNAGEPRNGLRTPQVQDPGTPFFPIGPVNCSVTPFTAAPSTNADPASCTQAAPTACEDVTHHYGWTPSATSHKSDFEVKYGNVKLDIRNIVTGQHGAASDLCKAHYIGPASDQVPLELYAGDAAPTLGTLDGFNDDTIFLCLQPDQPTTGGLPGTKGLGTGINGTFSYTPPGTACGTPAIAAAQRPVCDIADIGPDASFTTAPNAMVGVSGKIRDISRPVVMNATTDDRDHNGKVDAVKVSFSEAMDANSIILADWNVEGHSVTEYALPANPSLCKPPAAGGPALDHLWLCFAEVVGESTFDTGMGHSPGSGPRVTYAGGGAARDKATVANALRPYASPATDGAQPVAVRLQSQVGSATSTVTYSEPVDGTGSAAVPGTLSITYNDLYYQDKPDAASSASGFGSNQVVHSPGDTQSVLTLNGPASEYDIANDKVCFVAGNVKEHGGGLPLYNTCFGLNGVAGDLIPPPPVTGLALDPAAPPLTIVWDTPSSTDIVTIEVWECTACTISDANIRTGTGPVLAVSRPAVLGTHETYLLNAPAGWKTLSIAVATVDGSANRAVSQVLTLTPTDSTPPQPVTGLAGDGKSTLGDRATLSFTAPSDDTPTEPVTGYHVYQVVGTSISAAQATVANQVAAANLGSVVVAQPGTAQQITVGGLAKDTTYTFAVIAYDEGGNEATLTPGAQTTVTTSAASDGNKPTPITPATIRQRNLDTRVNATAATTGTGNVVNWTLPAEDAKHPTLGVQVWRCSTAATSSCILVANLTKDSAAFKARSFTDVNGKVGDRYLVTSYYGDGKDPAKDGFARSSADGAQIPGFSDMSPTAVGGTGGIPMWVWLVLGGILLVLLVVGIFMMARRKGGTVSAGTAAAGEWPAEEVPMEETGSETVPDAAAPAGAMEHHITCPKCSTEFTVTGVKPMGIQCPSCGVRGMLR